MADTQKTLSFSAILVLAANTMNGPGITTLPDVCSDAGRILFITLIFLSVAMASFVCRRMVSAMWSTIDNETAVSVGKNEDYGSGIEHSLSIDGEVIDEVIPQVMSDESEKLTHREHEHEENDEEDQYTETEGESLIPQDTKVHDRPQLESTSIVGQSLEAYGKQTSVYTSFLMVASALCLGLAQMMLCAAILDGMSVALGGKSCALGLPSSDNEWSPVYCTTNSSMKPFMGSGAPVSLISVGWVIASTASVLMGSVALDEMMGVQYFLFGCLVVASIRFSFVLTGMTDDGFENDHGVIANNDNSGEVSWFFGPNPFQCFGPIMFNFAFIVTSPPSVCLAKSEKYAYKALGASCVVMGALYTLVGMSGASISNVVRKSGQDSNLLSLILLSGGEDGASLFDLCIIGLFGFSTIASVPVYCLLAKDTLIYDAGVPPLLSFLLSNVLPWILVALTYNASFFEAFVNWSGLLVLGYANFSLPLMLDLKLKKVRADIAMSMSTNISQPDDDEQTTTITKGVLIIVTASITGVIAISISDSLLLAGLAFGSLVAMMLKTSH